MKKLSLIIIALIAFVQGAWATDYNVSNEAELRGAIENGANITLTQDIIIGSAITFNDGITVTIDLGGYTLNRNSTSGNRSQVIGVFSGSTLNISNGTLTGGWGGDGGIINQATLNMTNVTITGNKGNDRGGGISNNGTLTMTDCTVTGNTSLDATDPAGGGGIFNYNGKEATLTNCTITGNTANTYGGGGICNYGTMYLTNCSVTNNTANTTGGGIWNGNRGGYTGTLSINGCTITGNSAGSYGDGIYINNSTLNMQGLCTVTGNTDSNIYLYGSGTVITVTGAFTSDSNIGLGSSDNIRAYTSGYSTYNSAAPDNYFSFDNGSYAMGLKNGEVYPSIYYVECSWDGGDTDGHVVKTTKVCTDYQEVGGRAELSGGWYFADYSDTYSDNRIQVTGDTHLILKDGVMLTCKKGIQIKDGYTLTIYAQSDGENMGAIKCTGDGGGTSNGNASIGGNADEMGGYLFIHGGNIYAHAYHNNAAGLGGGNHESGMRGITIYGGTIDAKGSDSGAGIGEGQQNNFNTPVTIYGGDITATGGYYAAGIGGSEDRSNGTIKIYGGTVNATGGQWGSGIGSGETGDQNNPVYIYGGNVTANGGKYGAGIGGGYKGKGGDTYIYGGTVNATGGNRAAGIGGGQEGTNGTVKIYGGTVNATGGNNRQNNSGAGAGIGGGYKCGQDNPIYIYGGDVTATGGKLAAGIGGGYRGNGGTVTIYGGTVNATGATNSAGIGGGGCDSSDNSGGSGGTVTVNGGNVTVTGGYNGAGIGGGSNNSGGTFTVNGGTVTITGGNYGAGIGGGDRGDGGTVTINGGTVTVEGVKGNAIGAGEKGNSDGSLTLGSTFSVKPDGGSWVSSGNRVSTLRATGTYIIQECDHSSIASYSNKDDYYHHVNCSYCEGYDEHHVKGEGDACTYCGHELPAYSYTLYEANAEGTGYAAEGTTYYVTATHEFTFPSCSVVPNKMTFAGWLLSNDTVPSSLIAGSTENLIQADSTITVPMEENRTYYARFKNTYFSGGSGSASDPFLISDTEDWDHLANAVNDGINFNGMYFVMTNDISTVTTMAGQGSNRFRGNFDGQGYTLTVSYTGITADYCAPFRHISGATIKNLNTAGTIETSGRYAAGVVAYTRYYSKIENCHSNVTIRSSREGWAGHGGILGLKANVSYSQPTIEGCVFDGKILSTGASATTGGGGIVGLTNGQTLTIENCLYKPAALENNETAVLCSTIYANSSSAPSTVTCTDCYYTEAYGSAESGTRGYTVTSGTTGLTLDFGSASSTYAYNGIKVYSFGLSYDGLLYSGNGQSVTFTIDVAEGYTASDIKANGNALTPDSNGIYTLTMPNANVSITATMTPIASREVAAAEDWTTASKGWVFIASPVITSEDMEPEDVSGLVAENEDDYDLYRLNPSNTKWENWKEHEGNAAAGFCLENGRGYLYATKYAMTLIFAGTFNTKDKDTIPLSPGFNLVGNPFTVAANINKPYYTLNSDGSAVQTATSSDPIPPCHGVIVQATSANDSVVFTKATQQSAGPSNSGLRIALTQANTRSNALLDNAIITFNEGCQLGKFYFGTQNANIYIPQGNQDYAIAFSEGQGEMPLNFKDTEDGTYMITVHPENVEMTYLHLIDNLTGADVDLLGRGDSTPPTYTFTAKTTDYESRFRLVFSVCGDADGDNAPFAFISNGNIIITGITGDACNASLQVIDVMGRIVRCSKDAVPASLPTTGLVPGVYVLRLINGENSKIQKIVIQ